MNKNNIVKDVVCMFDIKNNVDVVKYDDLVNYFGNDDFKKEFDEHYNVDDYDNLMFINDGYYMYIVIVYDDMYYDCYRVYFDVLSDKWKF